jgi:hypothetical protein
MPVAAAAARVSPMGTVYHYFRSWDDAGVWVQMGRALYEQARVVAGR